MQYPIIHRIQVQYIRLEGSSGISPTRAQPSSRMMIRSYSTSEQSCSRRKQSMSNICDVLGWKIELDIEKASLMSLFSPSRCHFLAQRKDSPQCPSRGLSKWAILPIPKYVNLKLSTKSTRPYILKEYIIAVLSRTLNMRMIVELIWHITNWGGSYKHL